MIRIHIGTYLIVFSVIYSAVSLKNLDRKVNSYSLIYWATFTLGILVLVSIVMTRAVLLGLLPILFLLLFERLSRRRIMLVSLAIVLLASLSIGGYVDKLYKGSFVDQISSEAVSDVVMSEGSVGVRQKSAMFHLKLYWDNSPFSGIGLFSDRYFPTNPLAHAKNSYHFFLSDVNGLSTIVSFGIFGAFILIYLTVKSIKDLILLMRKSNESLQKKYYFVLFFFFCYMMLTPTMNNVLVAKNLVYTGIFFFLINLSKKRY